MSEIFSKMVARYTELYMKAGVGLTVGLAKLMKPAMKTLTGDKQKPINDFEAKVLFDKLQKDSGSYKFSFGEWAEKLGDVSSHRGSLFEVYKEATKGWPLVDEPEPTKADLENLEIMMERLKTEGLFTEQYPQPTGPIGNIGPSPEDVKIWNQTFEEASLDPDFKVFKTDSKGITEEVKVATKPKKTKSKVKSTKSKIGKKKAAKKPTKKKSKK